MDSLQSALPAIGVTGAILGFAGVVATAVLWSRFQRFARPYEELARAAASEGTTAALQAQLLGVESNSERIATTLAYIERVESRLQFALQGVGFLKYDAFEDIRGQQSYSLCLLDGHRNGFIVTSIAGRNDYRGYAKPVKKGTCDLAMSDEEKQVLEMARASLSGVVADKPAKNATPQEPTAPTTPAAPEPQPANA